MNLPLSQKLLLNDIKKFGKVALWDKSKEAGTARALIRKGLVRVHGAHEAFANHTVYAIA